MLSPSPPHHPSGLTRALTLPVLQALRLLLAWGWILKQKERPGSSRRFTFSHVYARQHGLHRSQALLTEAANVDALVQAADGPRPSAAALPDAEMLEAGEQGGAEATGAAVQAVPVSIPRSLGPGAIVHALEMAVRGEVRFSIEAVSQDAAAAGEGGQGTAVMQVVEGVQGGDGRRKRPVPFVAPADAAKHARRLAGALGGKHAGVDSNSTSVARIQLHCERLGSRCEPKKSPDSSGSTLRSSCGPDAETASTASTMTTKLAIEQLAASDEPVAASSEARSAAELYARLDAEAASNALNECIRDEGGALVEALHAVIDASGPSGVPLITLLHGDARAGSSTHEPVDLRDGGVGTDAGALQCARAVLDALQAMRRRSLVVRVCVGDERRYVSQAHAISFWAARPYDLVDDAEGASGGDASGPAGDGDGEAAETSVQAAAELDAGSQLDAAPGRKRRAAPAVEMTPSGKRPHFDASSFHVQEAGRGLSAADSDHSLRVREAIGACVTANPGVVESQLLDRFWGVPKCHVLAALHAMMADGEIYCSVLCDQPSGLFGGGSTEASRCFFSRLIPTILS